MIPYNSTKINKSHLLIQLVCITFSINLLNLQRWIDGASFRKKFYDPFVGPLPKPSFERWSSVTGLRNHEVAHVRQIQTLKQNDAGKNTFCFVSYMVLECFILRDKALQTFGHALRSFVLWFNYHWRSFCSFRPSLSLKIWKLLLSRLKGLCSADKNRWPWDYSQTIIR